MVLAYRLLLLKLVDQELSVGKLVLSSACEFIKSALEEATLEVVSLEVTFELDLELLNRIKFESLSSSLSS